MKIRFIIAVVMLFGAMQSAAFAQPALVTASTSGNASSWLAGAQAGYNWQSNSLVYGLEADISATHLNNSLNTVLTETGFPPAIASTNADVDWYGTLRGRLGWSQGPVLFYGTAGLAYGHIDLNSTISTTNGPVALASQTSAVRAGWVAGAGIDYLWRPNVILSLGYQYVDLGTLSFATATTQFSGILTQSASTHARFQTFTVGVSWLFPPAGRAPGAWEGFYAGGHIGGAWGNNTDANYAYRPAVASDIRLKRDIVLVGRLDDGLGLYRYRYRWSEIYVGVMAQEVALIRPDAIVRGPMDDYLRVDYGRLGLKLMTMPEWQAISKGERL